MKIEKCFKKCPWIDSIVSGIWFFLYATSAQAHQRWGRWLAKGPPALFNGDVMCGTKTGCFLMGQKRRVQWVHFLNFLQLFFCSAAILFVYVSSTICPGPNLVMSKSFFGMILTPLLGLLYTRNPPHFRKKSPSGGTWAGLLQLQLSRASPKHPAFSLAKQIKNIQKSSKSQWLWSFGHFGTKVRKLARAGCSWRRCTVFQTSANLRMFGTKMNFPSTLARWADWSTIGSRTTLCSRNINVLQPRSSSVQSVCRRLQPKPRNCWCSDKHAEADYYNNAHIILGWFCSQRRRLCIVFR